MAGRPPESRSPTAPTVRPAGRALTGGRPAGLTAGGGIRAGGRRHGRWWAHGSGPASGQVAGTTAPSGAGSFGILVLGSLVERPADPVAEGVGGLAGERRVQVAQGGAREEVLLA